MTPTVDLDGKTYQIIEEGSCEYDFRMMDVLHRAGIDRIEMRQGEDVDAFVVKILDSVGAAKMELEVLGHLLAPAELPIADWTPDVAVTMTAMLRRLTAREDKQAVRACFAGAMVGFFQHGRVSLTISGTSSATDGQPGRDATRESAGAGA
jgi:hypothetical protein